MFILWHIRNGHLVGQFLLTDLTKLGAKSCRCLYRMLLGDASSDLDVFASTMTKEDRALGN